MFPDWEVKSEIAYSINSFELVLWDNLINPLTAEVTESIVSKNELILLPLSSVTSIITVVAEVWVIKSFNPILP